MRDIALNYVIFLQNSNARCPDVICERHHGERQPLIGHVRAARFCAAEPVGRDYGSGSNGKGFS